MTMPRSFSLMVALTAISLATILVSCQANRQQQPHKVPLATGGNPEGNNSPAGLEPGGGDGGGENTFRGRQLEAYVRVVRQLPAYENIVSKKFSNLGGDTQFDRLIRFMVSKNWFFMPTELKLLPRERVGALVPTEQLAKHKFREVWLNSLIFDAMTSERDQAESIVHEILMGIKVLKYDSPARVCLAIAKSPDWCTGVSSQPVGTSDDVDEGDHADVRRATTEIMRISGPVTFDEMSEILARNNFSLPGVRFARTSDYLKIKKADVLQYFKTAQITGNKPMSGFKIGENKKEKCKIDFYFENYVGTMKYNNSGEAVRVKLTRENGHETEQLITFQDVLHTSRGYSEDGRRSYVPIYGLKIKPPTQVGSREIDFRFKFEGDTLYEVDVSEMICTNMLDAENCGKWGNPSDKFRYVCTHAEAP